MNQPTIGFLGSGNMAESLIRGLQETAVCLPEKITASDINEIRLAYMAEKYGVQTTLNNRELARKCSVLVLAVKPQQADAVMNEMRSVLDPEKNILISLVAGLTTAGLEKAVGQWLKVVRVMPNTPARLRAGTTAFCLGQYAGEAETLLTHMLFEPVGIVVRVEEALMNAVTALSGSGPAYVFHLCEMMIKAGVQMGLSSREAGVLSVQTIMGAARMLNETGQPAAELRAAVTSPGGTTEAALDYLAASDYQEIFIKALEAARNRGKEITLSKPEE
ncbi:pyrroline-5-carboxylate reductase [bacterium]|nr:pyrroline-5-carboxylate reductase [bacterium]